MSWPALIAQIAPGKNVEGLAYVEGPQAFDGAGHIGSNVIGGRYERMPTCWFPSMEVMGKPWVIQRWKLRLDASRPDTLEFASWRTADSMVPAGSSGFRR